MPSTTRVALVGKTGSGKSTLGNALLQREPFRVIRSFSSCTSECQCETAWVNSRQLKVVDTPGTFDTFDSQRGLQEVKKVIQLCPEGFHAFLLVVKCGRFTQEEDTAITTLRREFGDSFFEFSIFVFTNGVHFDNDRQCLLENLRSAPDSLKTLLDKCSWRVALIENGKRRDREQQTEQLNRLLSMIDELHRSKGEPYTNRMFLAAQEEERRQREREEMERRRREEMQREREARERRRREEMQRQMADLQRQKQEAERRRKQQAEEQERQLQRLRQQQAEEQERRRQQAEEQERQLQRLRQQQAEEQARRRQQAEEQERQLQRLRQEAEEQAMRLQKAKKQARRLLRLRQQQAEEQERRRQQAEEHERRLQRLRQQQAEEQERRRQQAEEQERRLQQLRRQYQLQIVARQNAEDSDSSDDSCTIL